MKVKLLSVMLLGITCAAHAQKMPLSLKASMNEPVRYTGGLRADSSLFDGGLPHAVGVHHYQVLRANRAHPEVGTDHGWTYSHQPYLAYWNGKFYLQYLSGEYSEHTPPTRVLMTTSTNGKDWSAPEIVFPVYDLPEINTKGGHLPAGTKSVMHQRMGFYHAPNGKLLTLAFYSYTLSPRHSPNDGNGLGRVVREVKEDGSYGPIYFIRYNAHNGYGETNTNFPFYKKSDDKAFVEACDSLLNNKLVTLQWWEEDRAKDGFFAIDPGSEDSPAFSKTAGETDGGGKAFDFFHRRDGIVVGMWKNEWGALSADEGKTWTPITKNKTLHSKGAKIWGQRLDDGNFAIVCDQTSSYENRYPMVVMTSEDGRDFNKMFSLKDDVSPMRYQGLHKGQGPQYFRGIIEGNGNPPGNEMWVTYSINKEDIWITSVDVPVRAEEKENVSENFDNAETVQDLKKWNVYLPQWAPVSIYRDASNGNKYLELKDEDPYDYAKVERLFPKSKKVEISFRIDEVMNQQGHALEIEVQDQRSVRPIRLRIDQDWIMFDLNQVEADPLPFSIKKWAAIRLVIDVEKQSYAVYLDGKLVKEEIEFAEKVTSVERLVFRTGPYRGYTDALLTKDGPPAAGGIASEDLPASGQKVPANIYWLDDVSIKKIK